MGLSTNPSSEQHQRITDSLTSNSLGLFGIQEININMAAMGPTGKWNRRFQHFQGFTRCATNEHTTSTSKVLHGGTGLFVQPTLRIRQQDSGVDECGLGRWSWVLLEGRNGMRTRVISGYRPVEDKSDRPNSVFSQHEFFFRQQGRSIDPREAFLVDLSKCIRAWMSQGDNIIFGSDINEDTASPTIKAWAHSLGLINVHSSHLGVQARVATCDKSTRTQIPIDGIWCTPSLRIRACGMTGFGQIDIGTIMDHRILWVDFEDDSLFGFRAPPPVKRTFLPLTLTDPGARRHYARKVRDGHRRHNLHTRLHQLERRALDGRFRPQDVESYNRLADVDHTIRLEARARHRRFYGGQVEYSDTLGRIRKEIHLWNLLVRHRSRRRVDSRKLRRLMAQVGVTDALQLTLPQILERQSQNRLRYRDAKSRQQTLREEFMRRVAKRRAKKYKTSVDAQLKTAATSIRLRRQHRNVKFVLNKKPKTPMNNLVYDGPDGTPVVCNSKAEVEHACEQEALRRFSQSHDTPFLSEPLLSDVGYMACQQTVDSILQGTYSIPAEVDEATRTFISSLTIPEPVLAQVPIDGIVTPTDHIRGWSKMRGRTSSSPFGPDFSDYIAGCDHIKVAEVDTAFANIPIRAGFCPRAWTKALDVMIPKKGASRHVRKLRIIILFHSLFNMLNKRIGREMVHRADSLGLIPMEAYGSRPGCRANVCALNKVLTSDMFRQRRKQGIICSNDAISCYDRIVHAIASICMQRLGVSPEVCKVMFGTLQELQHFVTTEFGRASTPYGALKVPLHGVGQGNGAGPAIWLVMSMPLINLLRDAGLGLSIVSSLSGTPIEFSCFTFVDDSDTVLSPRHRLSTAALIADMQKALDLWDGALRATGGALTTDEGKTFWWLVDFYWHVPSQTWRYVDEIKCPGTLTLETSPGVRTPIQRLPPSAARETLGVYISMDGDQSSMLDALDAKIFAWSDKIRTGQLSKVESWLSLRTGISKSLDYPLVATCFSYKDCDWVTRSLKIVALPALGLPKTFPHRILYAPVRYLGYGLADLWFEQNFVQMATVLHHGHLPDITGHLLRDQVETLRLTLGLPRSPFTYPFTKWSRVSTYLWIYGLWEYCSTSGLTLLDHLPDIPVQRVHDQFLMEAFAAAGYCPKDLALLNHCRMYRRVIYLSDLTTGDGKYLLPGTLTDRSITPLHSSFEWPRCMSPNNHCWKLWSTALQRCFLPPVSTIHLPLRVALGAWYGLPRGWPTYYSASQDAVYTRSPTSEFMCYKRRLSRHRTRFRRFALCGPTPALPFDVVPTTTLGSGTLLSMTGTSSISSAPAVASSCPERWWGHVIQPADDLSILRDGILCGTAVGVTDGSFKSGLGTAAYILRRHIMDPSDDLILVNHTPGLPDQLDAFRAELGGAVGVIHTVHELVSSVPPAALSTAAVTLACDCQSVLLALSADHDPRPHASHYDLLMEARSLLRDSPVRWKFQHVYGHRDEILPYHKLTPWEKMNCDADRLAKAYSRHLSSNHVAPFSLPACKGQWSLWHGSHRVTTWTKSSAEDLYYGPSTRTYWHSKLQVVDPQLDWDALSHAFRRTQFGLKVWIPRYLLSFLPIGKNLLRWKITQSDLCPRCPNPEDHRHHLFTCSHPAVPTQIQSAITTLDAWLSKKHTLPFLQQTCLLFLRSAIFDAPCPPPAAASPMELQAFHAQFSLGLPKILDGLIHPSWTALQQSHYLALGLRNTGKLWHSQLVRRIWQIAWDSWRHRNDVLHSPDSLSLARSHEECNRLMKAVFHHRSSLYSRAPARWFSRGLIALRHETLDFKESWLTQVRSYAPTSAASGTAAPPPL